MDCSLLSVTDRVVKIASDLIFPAWSAAQKCPKSCEEQKRKDQQDRELSELENKLKILQLESKITEAKREEQAQLKILHDITDYKTGLCLNYLENNGKCEDGLECKFAHGTVELRDEAEPLVDYLTRYLVKNPKIASLKIHSKAFSARP